MYMKLAIRIFKKYVDIFKPEAKAIWWEYLKHIKDLSISELEENMKRYLRRAKEIIEWRNNKRFGTILHDTLILQQTCLVMTEHRIQWVIRYER